MAYRKTTSDTSTKKWGRRYPWDDWFANCYFELVRGIDYNGRTDTMMVQIRTQAGKRGLKVSVSSSDDGSFIGVAVHQNP